MISRDKSTKMSLLEAKLEEQEAKLEELDAAGIEEGEEHEAAENALYAAEDAIWDEVGDNVRIVDVIPEYRTDASGKAYAEFKLDVSDEMKEDFVSRAHGISASLEDVTAYSHVYSDTNAVMILEISEKEEVEIPLNSVESTACADMALLFMEQHYGKDLNEYIHTKDDGTFDKADEPTRKKPLERD